MTKTIEAGDCVVWLTDEGAMSGTVQKADAWGINIADDDGKIHRIKPGQMAAVCLPENRLKLGYALSRALKDHRDRLDASHTTLKTDRAEALAKWAL